MLATPARKAVSAERCEAGSAMADSEEGCFATKPVPLSGAHRLGGKACLAAWQAAILVLLVLLANQAREPTPLRRQGMEALPWLEQGTMQRPGTAEEGAEVYLAATEQGLVQRLTTAGQVAIKLVAAAGQAAVKRLQAAEHSAVDDSLSAAEQNAAEGPGVAQADTLQGTAVAKTGVMEGQAAGEDVAAGGASAEEALAGGPLPVGQRPVSLIVAISEHKTGTYQLRCVTDALMRYNATQPKKVQWWGVTGESVRQAHAEAPKEGPPALLLTEHVLVMECRSPGGSKCPEMAPCDDNFKAVLSLANCTLELPGPDVGFLHTYRNPLDLVLSAYWYHTQLPAPEEWIEESQGWSYAEFLAQRGTPLDRLHSLGMASNASYGSILRSLPEDQGVRLEFWRTAQEMYAQARLYRALSAHPSVLQLRFEDLQRSFDASMQRLGSVLLSAGAEAGAWREPTRRSCDPTAWNAEERSQSSHVTSAKHSNEDKARLKGVLMGDPEIRAHLCTLARALEYKEPLCSGAAKAGAAQASKGRRALQ